MNKFQEQCTKICKEIILNKGCSLLQFHSVIGKRETYLRAEITADAKYEIYVYDDEAGLMIGHEWFPFEKADYPSPEKLIEAFGRLLREKIPRLLEE